jgi:hypothetical protein
MHHAAGPLGISCVSSTAASSSAFRDVRRGGERRRTSLVIGARLKPVTLAS